MARRALGSALRLVGGDFDEDSGRVSIPPQFLVRGLDEAFGVFSVNDCKGEAVYHLRTLASVEASTPVNDAAFARDMLRACDMVRTKGFYAVVLACVGANGDAFTQLCVFERPK